MTQIPGDRNNDGVVNFADVTAALAAGLSFEAVTETLAGMVPATPTLAKWRTYLDPPDGESRRAIIWGPSVSPKTTYVSDNPTPGLTIEGQRITTRIRPPAGSDPATRWLALNECTIEGDGGPWGLVRADEWGGGVWFYGCTIRNVQSVPAHVAAFDRCDFFDISVDVFHNCGAVYLCTVNGIRKPAGSTAHPDLWQQSWPGGKPGPLAVWGLTARNVFAQPFFARSSVKLPAILLADINVEVTPDCAYVSQLMRELGDVRIENVRIRRGTEARPIQIRNDPAAGIPKTTLDSLTVIDSDVVIDPKIQIGGTP